MREGGRVNDGTPRVPSRRPATPTAVSWIVRTLEEAGFETWAVGGAVRDALLGIGSTDWDLASRARPADVRRLFPRTVPIGIEHGTVGVLARGGTMYEVTTFRRDVETFGRHAVVEFAETLDEDLGRRDFTINAMAWHPIREELHDPFEGAQDLRNGILRTVGRPEERFAEDYLRVLRALRFAGRFGLEYEQRTWDALTNAVDGLGRLSPERVREELMKVVEGDPHPSRALGLWATSGALAMVAPELGALVGFRVGGRPGDLDAWTFGARAAETIPMSRPWVRLTALVVDVGLPPSPLEPSPVGAAPRSPEDDPSGSSERAQRRMAALMFRLRFSNAARDRVAGNAGAPSPPWAESPDRVAIRRFLSAVGRARVPDLVRAWAARARVSRELGDATAPARVVALARALRAELASGNALTFEGLELNGRDLIRMGLKPGPSFKDILADLMDDVLEDPSLNQREALEAIVRERWMDDE